LFYGLYAAFWGAIYAWMTVPYMLEMVEGGDVLAAYIYNLGTIVFWIFLDWILKKFMFFRRYLNKNIFTKILKILLLPKSGLVSFKTGLYMFYVFMLIYSMLMTHSPYIEPTTAFQQYVSAMEYGIIILLAVDMFIKQFLSDNQRIKDMEEDEKRYEEEQKKKDEQEELEKQGENKN